MTKILSQKKVFQSKFISVFENELEFKNGTHRTHTDAIRDPGVFVYPIDEDGNIYLIEQYRYLHSQTIIEGVAGMIENGDDPLMAAKKELKEEAGITAKVWKKIAEMKAGASIISWNNTVFLAQELTFGSTQLEDSEEISVIKVSLERAVAMVMSGEIFTSSSIAGILMIDKLRQEGKI
jgi:ADP-ribose pyrophosphatase